MHYQRIWPNVWVSLVLLLDLATPAQAQSSNWTMQSFRAELEIQSDASIIVTEIIAVNFFIEKHGIFRDIPWRYPTENGEVTVPIGTIEVMRDGRPEPFEQSMTGNNIRIKIGDAGVTISGPHTYTIQYIARAAVNFFDDHDELYWNVTGNDWEVPVQQVSATVRFDQPSTQKVFRQLRCLTGPVGSTDSNCTTEDAIQSASFSADEPLTIVVGWDKGIVTKPSDYDETRASAGKTPAEIILANPILFWGLNAGFPLLVIAWLIRRWMTHGRDPKGKGTVVAQYDPPVGMTPGEMGTLFDERANHRDVVATIVDLAVRGYLTITEIKTQKFLGSSTDFRLEKISTGDASKLKPHEQKLLSGLFEDGDSITLSSLKGSFHDDVKAIQSDLYSQVRDQGYFYHNPNSVRIVYIAVGLGVAFLSFFGLAFAIFGPLVAGIAIAMAGPFMPKRTNKGADALWHAKGFKLFLEKAEKHRLQWQEKEHIFEQLLPYAMAFGVAEKWSKTFAGIQQAPPSWYHGAYGPNFNTLVLWSALNNFSTNTVRSFAPPAASGSSGFGGGGFSGGGFGGGGGGSW